MWPMSVEAAASLTGDDVSIDVNDAITIDITPRSELRCGICNRVNGFLEMFQYGEMWGEGDTSIVSCTSSGYNPSNQKQIRVELTAYKGGQTQYMFKIPVYFGTTFHPWGSIGIFDCINCGYRNWANWTGMVYKTFDVTVYDTFTLNYNVNGGIGEDGSISKRAAQEYYTFSDIPTPTRDGYEFLGWSSDSNAAEADNNALTVGPSPTDTSKTVYAVWKEKKEETSYTVYREYYYHGVKVAGIESGKRTGITGNEIIGKQLAEQNPDWVTYTIDGNDIEFGYTESEPARLTLDKDAKQNIITLKYNLFKVTYTDGAEGEIFGDEVHGKLMPNTETPQFLGEMPPVRDGYNFMGWAPAIADKVTDNVTYQATWEKVKADVPDAPTAQEVNKQLRGSNTAAVEVYCEPKNHKVGYFEFCVFHGIT